MTGWIDAALAIALASEASSRVEVVGTPVQQIAARMRAELAPKFKAIWDADNPREYLRMARRVGKTHYLVRRQAAKASMGAPEAMNPYILPTHKSCRLVVWPLAKRIVLRHFPEAVVNETLTTIALPVGGTLVYGGCETMADVGRWYGMAFAQAVTDERGNFPDAVLVELDDEALEPSLMDFGGDFSGGGNPGRTLRGRWYDQTKDGVRDDPTPLYIGDARENPFLSQPAAEYFERVKERHGWTDTTPTFRRQYLGEWVEDAEGLVFPFTAANMIDKLPERSRMGGILPAAQWRYVIGVDVGYVDSTAIAVLAAHPLDNREVIVSAEKYSQWLPDQLGHRLRELRRQYASSVIVMDTGGMGKVHAAELTRKFGMAIIPAEKRDKASAVRIMRDDIRSGRLVAIASECGPLLEEASVVGWDDDKLNPEEGMPDDCIHATMYAKRWNHHYGNRQAEPVAMDDVSVLERESAALKQRHMQRNAPRQGRAAWDR